MLLEAHAVTTKSYSHDINNAKSGQLVPKTMTSGAKADGRFDRADFIYDAQKNVYRCPAGQSLIWRYSTVEREMTAHRYWRSPCGQCAIKLWIGAAHFLTKTIDRVSTEMGLHVLAYNLKRVMKILSPECLMAAMRG